MESWIKVSAYFANELAKRKDVEKIDLLTLNKVMYFAQRESYIRNDKPLFDTGIFHAAQYGPVIIELKERLSNGNLIEQPSNEWINSNKTLLDYVVDHYGSMSPYTLSTLSHSEISWRNAREQADTTRYQKINESDIRIDALKIRLREQKLRINDLRAD